MYNKNTYSPLEIKPDKKLSAIQADFNTVFPFLKLEFFRHPHKVHGTSPKKDLLQSDRKLKDLLKKQSTESLLVTEDMLVSSLEEMFREKYGVSVQIFRKSGRSWLETTLTDDWTLKQQNDQGKELSFFA
jgi:hypothetical protein